MGRQEDGKMRLQCPIYLNPPTNPKSAIPKSEIGSV